MLSVVFMKVVASLFSLQKQQAGLISFMSRERRMKQKMYHLFLYRWFWVLFNRLATPRRLQSPLPPFSSSFPWACSPPVGSSPWPPCAGLPSSSSCSVVCNRCTTFCPLLGLRNGGTVEFLVPSGAAHLGMQRV